MNRMTPAELSEAAGIVMAESRPGAFATPESARAWLHSEVQPRALRLHSLYEGMCSVDLGAKGNDLRQRLSDQLERELYSLFAERGLDLYLNPDPRGNPVGIMTPATGRYNTMGGREAGWRL